jgi:hypothetical protein
VQHLGSGRADRSHRRSAARRSWIGTVSFSWRAANGIGIFVFDAKTHNEASEGAEGSRGVVTLRRATCRRGGSLEIGVSGTIASEFGDGKPVRVSGTYRGTVGSAPP